MAETQREFTSLVVTVSVTNPGGGGDPMVASRVVVDGQEVETPLVMVLGEDAGIQVIQRAASTPERAGAYATVFQRLASRLGLVVIKQMQQVMGAGEEENPSPQPPQQPPTA